MLPQHRFDLAWFDSIAADLYLIINAANIFEISIRQQPGQIAGAIKFLAFGKRIHDETVAGQGFTIQIAPRDSISPDEKLSSFTVCDRLQILI